MARNLKRLCPYCGARFDLGQSPIVSAAMIAVTSRPAPPPDVIVDDPLDGALFPGDDGDPFVASLDQASAASGAGAAGALPSVGGRLDLPGAHGVLWRPPTTPPVAPKRNAVAELVRSPVAKEPSLRPLSDFSVEKMPRRGCPHCLRALPKDIDHRQLHVLAIVGVTGATKSHFFASATGVAERKKLLSDLGCTEFEVDAESSDTYYQEYYVPFFRRGDMLKATPMDSSVRFNSITFKVTFEGHEPFLLMTHDVSGEALSSESARAQVTPFIRRASGVIFLVDPGEFDDLYDVLPAVETEPSNKRRISQGALLGHVLDEIEHSIGGRDIPVSIAVTKSDLLGPALGRDYTFIQASPRGSAWRQDIRDVDAEVRSMLNDIGEVQLLENAAKHSSVVFHAVSPAGGRPDAEDYTRPRPVRVEEPLGTVLYAISRTE